MTQAKFREIFSHKSNIELIRIADDQSGEYTLEAVQAALSLLSERLGAFNQIKDVLEMEIARLLKLTEKCSFCESDDVSYSIPFFLCKRRGIKLDWSSIVLSAVSLPTLGAGVITTKRQFDTVKLTLNLCSNCENNKTKKRFLGGTKLCLEERDYYNHPLCELYFTFGFTELKFESDFD